MHGISAESKGHAGKEYWKSRLYPHGEDPGRYTKKLTHKKERHTIKQLVHKIMETLWNTDTEYF